MAEQTTYADIFGGDSDLSDLSDTEYGVHQQQQAPARPAPQYREETPSEDEEREDPGEEGDEDYAQPGASTSRAAAADEEEEAAARDGKLPKFKKTGTKEKTAGEPKKRKPKRKPAEGDAPPEEEPITLDPAEQRKLDLYERIDLAAKGGKARKRKRRDGDDDLEIMADEEVAQLRQNMITAAEQDQDANTERRPATAKLVMLPIVTSTMQKSHLETALLENGVLEAVRRWLEPLPDKSLPALNIQRTLMQLLKKMNIDTQSLRSSELGKIMLFYTKCKRVEPSIKRMADELVMTWIRPIIGRSDRHRPRNPVAVSDPTISSQPRTASQSASQSQPGSQAQSQTQTRGVRIPETVNRAYAIAPSSVNQGHSGSSRVGAQKATAKKSRDFARKLAEARRGERRAM